FPNGHSGIGHADVYQGKQARELNAAQSPLVRNLHRKLIVQSRRRAQARGSVISPESADECLLFSALRGCNDPVAAQVFHFVVSGRVSSAGHVGWDWRAKLAA